MRKFGSILTGLSGLALVAAAVLAVQVRVIGTGPAAPTAIDGTDR